MENKVKKLNLVGLMISVVLILLLVGAIINLNNKNSQALDALTFELQQQSFLQNVALIKAKWILERRPRQLNYDFLDEYGAMSDQVVFAMSPSGWPELIDKDVENYCKVLMTKVTNTSLTDEYHQAIVSTKLAKEGDIVCQFCDAGNNEKCFIYSAD